MLWRTSIDGEDMNSRPVYCTDTRLVTRTASAAVCDNGVIMTATLRFLSLAMLTFWVGGLVALGFVAAPVLFDVLTSHDPETGRTLAGMAFGAILESFDRLALIAGGVIAATLAWRAARGPRPRWLVTRAVVLGLMLAATVVTGAVIAPRIDVIRLSTPTPIADLPDTDPAKIEFDRLHGLAGGLTLAAIAGGLALIWTEMQDR